MSSASNGSSKRAKIASALIVIVLILISSVIIYEASLLGWPFAAGRLGKLGNGLPNNPIPPNGTLSVQVSSFQVISGTKFVSPLPGALVAIYRGTTAQGNTLITNKTDSTGLTRFLLAPAEYTVKITDSLTNSTPLVTLFTYSELTTALKVNLNKTAYPASFFDIVNPDLTSNLPTWSPIYVQVSSSSLLPLNTITPYLSMGNPIISSHNASGVVPIEYPTTLPINVENQIRSSQNLLLVVLNLQAPASVAGVTQMTLLTISGLNYTLSFFNTTSGANVTP